jgi:hypothetical protein
MVDGVRHRAAMMVFDVSADPPPPMPPTGMPGEAHSQRFEPLLRRHLGQHGRRDRPLGEQQQQFVDSLAEAQAVTAAYSAPWKRLLHTCKGHGPGAVQQTLKGKRRLAVSEFSFTEIRAIRAATCAP